MAPQWFTCGYCHLQRLGVEPVHGGEPCPMKAAESAAYIAMLESQQASHDRSGFAMNDMTKIMKRMTGGDDDDD